ncbi:DUF4395 domain-containing protein [Phycicoccus sp. CSK15P-2]|uniref:DUF4395 domain-containing protein n=1 Tax=Phycicoccus sp. CSK15P-2 TaxID=2807627 RepID=UPI00194E47FE|nr:DUF4395 domain-containing protein [Phycicoccus sp. CSK15P-2]MBM6403129.1 DUF4395 domain-containing protein [Phycicoccus sp. CSK15P-2]
MRSLVGFPAVVNETAARSVAAGVVLLAGATMVTGWLWLAVVLATGFALRVLSGPRLSPLGRLAAQVVAPRLGAPRLVSGTPKRFAQGIGLVVSGAAVAALALGGTAVATALLAVLVVFATLEAVVGFCAGCYAFGLLIRAGIVSDDTCVECADITARRLPVAA